MSQNAPELPDTAESRAGLDAWRELPIRQQPTWPDRNAVDTVVAELRRLPPLVLADEIDELRAQLALAAQGSAFVLQGGDCAETFAGSSAEQIRDRLATIHEMSRILTIAAPGPIVTVGRMAGQFAKPRSSDTETRSGITLPAYRGDMVNGYDFTAASRTANPQRLLQGYHSATTTLNLIRAYSPSAFFVSHEGLLMDYERAMTRIDPDRGVPYDTSAHFLWIGERTRHADGAHVDFFARVHNPIGVKLGPEASTADVLRLIDRLDPDRQPGRLTLITRMGAARVREVLPPLLQAVHGTGAQPLWVCDPMHGNGITTPTGYKTRRFDDVVDETRGFFEAHRAAGTIPGGIHVELTGDDVTECLGGFEQIDEADLATRYESVCDPRLNSKQSVELAGVVADELLAAG